MNAKIAALFLAVMVLMGSASAASIFSEDYQKGYKDGCNLVGNMRYMDGILEGACGELQSLEKYFGDLNMCELISIYNDQVTKYNDQVETINGITKVILGDEADNYLLEYRPYYC